MYGEGQHVPTCGGASCGRKAELMRLTALSESPHKCHLIPLPSHSWKEMERGAGCQIVEMHPVYLSGWIICSFVSLSEMTYVLVCNPRSTSAINVLKGKSILTNITCTSAVCVFVDLCVHFHSIFISKGSFPKSTRKELH